MHRISAELHLAVIHAHTCPLSTLANKIGGIWYFLSLLYLGIVQAFEY